MSARLSSLAVARDAALVVTTAAFAFLFGAVASGLEPDHGSPPETELRASAAASGSGAFVPDPGERFGEAPHPEAARRTAPGADSPRVVRVESSEQRPTTRTNEPRDRFLGEGAGRKEAVILRDPYNRRVYIQEMAAMIHRRGWIGLDSAIGLAAAGSGGEPVRAQKPHGLR